MVCTKIGGILGLAPGLQLASPWFGALVCSPAALVLAGEELCCRRTEMLGRPWPSGDLAEVELGGLVSSASSRGVKAARGVSLLRRLTQ